VQRITGTALARTAIPANFKELQAVVDAGRVHELDSRSTVKQALWALAGELGLVRAAEGAHRGSGRGPGGFRRRKE
jgi:pilus assembly protein CpaE